MKLENFNEGYFSIYINFSDDKKTFHVITNPMSSSDTNMLDMTGSLFDELNRFVEFDFRFVLEYKKELKSIYERVLNLDISNKEALELFNEYIKLFRGLAAEVKKELPLLYQALITFIEENKAIESFIKFDFVSPMEKLWEELDGILMLQRNLYMRFEELSQLQLNAENRKELPVLDKLTNININVDLSYDNGELHQTYFVNSAEMLYTLFTSYFFASRPNISLCKNCNRFFEPNTKRVTLYCDRVTDSGRTCKKEGALSKHKNNVDGDEVLKKFNAERHRIYMYCTRSKLDQYDFFDDYYDWLDEAEPIVNEYKIGNISSKKAISKLNQLKQSYQSFSKISNTRNRESL